MFCSVLNVYCKKRLNVLWNKLKLKIGKTKITKIFQIVKIAFVTGTFFRTLLITYTYRFYTQKYAWALSNDKQGFPILFSSKIVIVFCLLFCLVLFLKKILSKIWNHQVCPSHSKMLFCLVTILSKFLLIKLKKRKRNSQGLKKDNIWCAALLAFRPFHFP